MTNLADYQMPPLAFYLINQVKVKILMKSESGWMMFYLLTFIKEKFTRLTSTSNIECESGSIRATSDHNIVCISSD